EVLARGPVRRSPESSTGLGQILAGKPPAHPGAYEHWHDITDQSPIRPSSTTAATTPLSSPALSSRRSSRNYPRLQPLRRQIPNSRPGAHRLPAGSFIGGFRKPAP